MARVHKRKSDVEEYTSDDGFVANDGEVADRPSKRPKTAPKSSHFATANEMQTDSEGNQYWEISKMRRVTVSEFKGKTIVSIREYYEQGGKVLPGKKGISMTLEQYAAFIEVMPQIEAALTKKGERVPRPTYGGAVKSEGDSEDGDDEEGGHGRQKKSNIEATSDEDEDD